MSASEQQEVAVVTPVKFVINDVVEHVKSGGMYVVAGLPTEYVIEATREPAYAYRMKDGRICVRCQSEFEDGRFVYRGRAENLGYPIETHSAVKGRA
ncbi:hypothetical protein [Burkholderia phage FLC9]|nr:hypothetical protein [Burkholderia phage FLC9]